MAISFFCCTLLGLCTPPPQSPLCLSDFSPSPLSLHNLSNPTKHYPTLKIIAPKTIAPKMIPSSWVISSIPNFAKPGTITSPSLKLRRREFFLAFTKIALNHESNFEESLITLINRPFKESGLDPKKRQEKSSLVYKREESIHHGINIKGILAKFIKNLEILMTLITQQRNFKDKLVINGHKCQELVNQWETNSKQY